MPELPEVETIRRELLRQVKHKKIEAVQVKTAKMINTPIAWFSDRVKGATIIDVRRRAKLLLIELTNGYTLVVHLKLTGQLIFQKRSAPLDAHTHIIFFLSGKNQLLFNDLRKFGYIKLIETKKVDALLTAMKFGPEPLDRSFTLEKFKALLGRRPNQPIKPLLMDQSFIAGIGNIYAQEACFYAHIKPTRPVKSLSAGEIKLLYQSLLDIVRMAIKKRGTSADTYRDLYGKKGTYDPLLKVYGREGEKCYRCGGVVQTIRLRGRGTALCNKCQR